MGKSNRRFDRSQFLGWLLIGFGVAVLVSGADRAGWEAGFAAGRPRQAPAPIEKIPVVDGDAEEEADGGDLD